MKNEFDFEPEDLEFEDFNDEIEDFDEFDEMEFGEVKMRFSASKPPTKAVRFAALTRAK